MPKKIIVWGLVAFLVFYLVTQPEGSANIVRSIAGGLADAADGLARFMSNLS
ncbi:MAG: hypothetical protein ACRDMV_05475 [Streptosporangiales bacterium]